MITSSYYRLAHGVVAFFLFSLARCGAGSTTKTWNGDDIAGAATFLPINGQRSRTDLCSAAKAYADKLEPRFVRAYRDLKKSFLKVSKAIELIFLSIISNQNTKLFGVAEFAGAIQEKYVSDESKLSDIQWGYDVSNLRFQLDNHGGTRVVQMRLPEKLRLQIIREIDWMKKLEGEIDEFLSSIEAGGSAYYNPLSLQFNNAILFTPSGFEFYQKNLGIITQLMPELGGVVLNAFVVPANESSYGVHNARSWAVGLSGSVCNSRPEASPTCMFAAQQRSLHTALEDVTYDHQPLIVYEDADAEVPSQAYMDKRLDHYFRQQKKKDGRRTLRALRAARYILLYPALVDESVFLSAAQFSFARYIEVKYCSLPWPVPGMYWKLQSGQALFFNNYVPHGKDEYTSNSMDEMPEHFQLRYRSILKSKDCIAKMLHYKGHDELMETITGGKRESNFTLVHLLTNIGLGLHGSYGKDRQDILTFEEGLRSHFERTKSLRGMAPRLTPEAKQCILEYTQEFSCSGDIEM
eukprot:jgi/Bigna1/67156/fgenesh1_pg.3_\